MCNVAYAVVIKLVRTTLVVWLYCSLLTGVTTDCWSVSVTVSVTVCLSPSPSMIGYRAAVWVRVSIQSYSLSLCSHLLMFCGVLALTHFQDFQRLFGSALNSVCSMCSINMSDRQTDVQLTKARLTHWLSGLQKWFVIDSHIAISTSVVSSWGAVEGVSCLRGVFTVL